MRDNDKKDKLDIYLRFLIKRDIEKVLAIESSTSEIPWEADDFANYQGQVNYWVKVAQHEREVVGYVVYEIQPKQLKILKMSVDPKYQRRGVGSQMIEQLTEQLSPERRSRLTLEVDGRTLGAQLFLQKQDFKALPLTNGGRGEDIYIMEYCVGQGAGRTLVDGKWQDRISLPPPANPMEFY